MRKNAEVWRIESDTQKKEQHWLNLGYIKVISQITYWERWWNQKIVLLYLVQIRYLFQKKY